MHTFVFTFLYSKRVKKCPTLWLKVAKNRKNFWKSSKLIFIVNKTQHPIWEIRYYTTISRIYWKKKYQCQRQTRFPKIFLLRSCRKMFTKYLNYFLVYGGGVEEGLFTEISVTGKQKDTGWVSEKVEEKAKNWCTNFSESPTDYHLKIRLFLSIIWLKLAFFFLCQTFCSLNKTYLFTTFPFLCIWQKSIHFEDIFGVNWG